jgi:D-serine deaminase-like pyridoxal phosphate-dependent protein
MPNRKRTISIMQRYELAEYEFEGAKDVLTPALVIYPSLVTANIRATIQRLGGDPDRWRPHVKTAKLAFVMKLLMASGIRNFKAATTLELRTLCELGASDVLMAYPATGYCRNRVAQLAMQYPNTKVSFLVDSIEAALGWKDKAAGWFVDINPGMNRTGMPETDVFKAVTILGGHESFRGLHYYDGHIHGDGPREIRDEATKGYAHLAELIHQLHNCDIEVPEVITSGTPTFGAAFDYSPLRAFGSIHRVSPGTVVYCDLNSLTEVPADSVYVPAALVLTTVVSKPSDDIVTCDAGHKSVSADAGVPTCAVLGHPEFEPQTPSEEHLTIKINGGVCPSVGDQLYLIPRHVCPTVNNFDEALLVQGGAIVGIDRVSARGRESPRAGSMGEPVELREQ